jgi:DNA-binding NarL/FixJ family response regulator
VPIRTFLVEDNAVIRANLTETLEVLAGVEVVGYAEGTEKACDWLTSHGDEWDLAIVDLFLADGSGLAVVDATQTRSKAQHVIVLSNYTTAPMREKCRVLGAQMVFDRSTQVVDLIDYCVGLATPRLTRTPVSSS